MNALAKINHSKQLDGPATWDTVKYWADIAGKLSHAFVAAQVMAGFALLELRKDHGNQGKRTDLEADASATSPNDLERLDWPNAVKKYAGVSDETARTWMKMAEGVRSKWKKLAPQEKLKELMAVPPTEWSDKETKLVCESVQKATDGLSQIEFMRELGLAKKPSHNAAPKGGQKKKLTISEEAALRKEQAIEDFAHLARILDVYADKFTLLSDSTVEAQISALEVHLKARRDWLKNPVGKRDAKAIAEIFSNAKS